MGFGPSPMEIAVIAVIALIVLGPQKLPEAAKSLGKGFREMRDSFQGAADGNEKLDEFPDDDEDEEEFGDELDEDEETELASDDDETSDEVDEDHQNDAESSVPSASSSSTERE